MDVVYKEKYFCCSRLFLFIILLGLRCRLRGASRFDWLSQWRAPIGHPSNLLCNPVYTSNNIYIYSFSPKMSRKVNIFLHPFIDRSMGYWIHSPVDRTKKTTRRWSAANYESWFSFFLLLRRNNKTTTKKKITIHPFFIYGIFLLLSFDTLCVENDQVFYDGEPLVYHLFFFKKMSALKFVSWEKIYMNNNFFVVVVV